jgi:predicted lipoprotein with Yx(FWY)xxD motif
MKRSRIGLVALAVALAGAGGGVAFAETSSSTPTAAAAPTATAGPGAVQTIQVITTRVGGQTERVLANAQRLPLYTYNLDTPTHSQVSGSLAELWPPLISLSPTEKGASGKLTVLSDSNGHQVEYNGHFLYTFLDDTPGQVTGQGVQGFSVATPSLATTTSSPTLVAPSNSNPYGY